MQPFEIFVLGALAAWALGLVLRIGRRQQGMPPGE
jgi:hypothetical protein